MHSDIWRRLAVICALGTGTASAGDAASPDPAGFVPIQAVIAGDCWGRFPDDVLGAVRGCKAADGDNRLALQVIDDELGRPRVGATADCGAARCAPLTEILAISPGRRLLLRTPARRLDAVAAVVQAAKAQGRVMIEPELNRVVGSSEPLALAPGVRYWHERIQAASTVTMLHIAEVDLDTPGLSLVGTAGDTSGGGEFSAAPTTQFARSHDLVLAVNASYFLPFEGGRLLSDAFVPLPGQGVDAEGLSIVDGKLVSDAATADRRVNAAFCVDRRGRAAIARAHCPRNTRLGLGAGPLLLLDRRRQPREASRADYYDHPAPRSAIGLDAHRRKLWVVVADGRQPGYSDGLTLDQLTAVFERLGATAAMNLDGGGSSTLVGRLHGQVRALNSPIHTGIPGRERAVATQLGVCVGTCR
ncbi:exopolysaccharide biosynthesis protein [Xanthomonas arboricola]|uniref:phosphodiester glycosidase family protein n=1 Tax=Xanthomonas TaxID=338 RepID=UPI0015E49189|nr:MULTISPECIES: phosphodiester glycosidase family protein [Xanthomonas]MBB5736458.1 exopolysaccharide biosynthesis protein [Xanthomonas sp. CFBP 8152]